MFSSPQRPGRRTASRALGAACFGEGPQDRSVGGLQALGARDRHPGHAEAPAALACVPGAEGQEKQQLLADIVAVSARMRSAMCASPPLAAASAGGR